MINKPNRTVYVYRYGGHQMPLVFILCFYFWNETKKSNLLILFGVPYQWSSLSISTPRHHHDPLWSAFTGIKKKLGHYLAPSPWSELTGERFLCMTAFNYCMLFLSAINGKKHVRRGILYFFSFHFILFFSNQKFFSAFRMRKLRKDSILLVIALCNWANWQREHFFFF